MAYGSRPRFFFYVATAACVAGLFSYYTQEEYGVDEPGSGANPVRASTLPPPIAASPIDLPALAAEPASQARPFKPIDPSWTSPLSSPNEYASLIAFRQQKAKGSFGKAHRLFVSGCALDRTLITANALDFYTSNFPSANYQDRALAYDKILARCNQFLADPNIYALVAPLADDSYGIRFVEAKKTLSQPDTYPATFTPTRKQVRAALVELADQGHLDLATDYVNRHLHWRGKRYHPAERDGELLQIASAVASNQLAELVAAPPEDIRKLRWCVISGICGTRYAPTHIDRFKSATPSEQQKILDMAADIERAVRAGDVDALMGRP